MTQTAPHFCPRCGTTLATGQIVCGQCGLNVTQRTAHDSRMHTPALKQRKLGRSGIFLLLLLALLLLGTIGYIVVNLLGVHVPGTGSTTQPPITSQVIQAALPYKGVNVTILDAQQARTFLDDPITNAANPPSVVRVHLQANNPTTTAINLLYATSLALVTPSRGIIMSSYIHAESTLAAGATQSTSIDFVVPENIKLGQLTLRVGTSNEAQMDVPLVNNADVATYMPKTTKLAGATHYLGLDWTLTSATLQMSVVGQQAHKGMRYLVLAVSVNNTLSQTAISGSVYDYARLQTGGGTATPTDTTLPVSFAAGASGQTGTITFLVPQNVTMQTFILQAQSGFDQATVRFQV